MPLVRGRSHSEILNFFSFAVWTNIKRERVSDYETKDIAGLVLTYNSKKLHWIKKLHLERTLTGSENPSRKKSHKKNRKTVINQSQNSTCEQKTTNKKMNFCSNNFHTLLENYIRKRSRHKSTRLFTPLPVSAWPKSSLQFDFKIHENVLTDHKKPKNSPQTPESTGRGT